MPQLRWLEGAVIVQPDRSFRLSMQFAGASALLFAVIHLLLPWIAYGGSRPVIPVKDPFVRWEIENNEMALVVLFVWAGTQAWTAAQGWAIRDRATLVTAIGLGAFFAFDAVYLTVRPMPVPQGWQLAMLVLTVFMAINALACANASWLLLSNTRLDTPG